MLGEGLTPNKGSLLQPVRVSVFENSFLRFQSNGGVAGSGLVLWYLTKQILLELFSLTALIEDIGNSEKVTPALIANLFA